MGWTLGTLKCRSCNPKIKCLKLYKYFKHFIFSVQEQVKWAVEEGCDYIIAETFGYLGEALLALDVIKEYAIGLLRLGKQASYNETFI